VKLNALQIPGLSDIPIAGKLIFGHDPLIYVSLILVVGVAHLLFKTRAGLVLRAVGENHASAHALGLSVLKVRLLAVLFGGGCAGLAGGYLSLAYTPQWVENMTAGRGWIALALVVFASWRPARVLAGAYLFGAVSILGFYVQAKGWGIPAQFLSALPYLVTILALVLISSGRKSTATTAPACLGQSFVPDR
jgi:simple sugar transport system permease protein